MVPEPARKNSGCEGFVSLSTYIHEFHVKVVFCFLFFSISWRLLWNKLDLGVFQFFLPLDTKRKKGGEKFFLSNHSSLLCFFLKSGHFVAFVPSYWSRSKTHRTIHGIQANILSLDIVQNGDERTIKESVPEMQPGAMQLRQTLGCESAVSRAKSFDCFQHPCILTTETISSDTKESLSAPIEVLLRSLARGLRHDTVNLGSWMRAVESDLLVGRVLKDDCRAADVASFEVKVVHGVDEEIPIVVSG